MFNERLLAKARWIDRALSCCFALSKVFSRRSPDDLLSATNPKKILVLESHLIGDSIMTIPVLRALKERFPSACIDVLGNTWASDLLKDQGYVRQVVTVSIPWATYDYSPRNLLTIGRTLFRLRRYHYDLSIDPRGDMRNNFLMWIIAATRRLGYAITGGAYFLTDIAPALAGPVHLAVHRLAVLSPLGIDALDQKPILSVPRSDQEHAARLLRECGVRQRFVVIHPGASCQERKWTTDKHVELIRRLHRAGVEVVVTGGPRDTNELNEIRRVARAPIATLQVSLMEFAAILMLSSASITMDSGAAHIGAAVSCPVIVLYGKADPRVVRPLGSTVHIITPPEGMPASPNSIEVDEVYSTLMKLMK